MNLFYDNVALASAEVEQLRVICSYCRKVLREGTPGARTSHGICTSPDCRAKYRGDAGRARTSHGICTSPECRAKFNGVEGLVEISPAGEVEHLA